MNATQWMLFLGGAALGAQITHAIWLRKFREQVETTRQIMRLRSSREPDRSCDATPSQTTSESWI